MATYKEIVGQKITKVTSDPSEPKTGQMWYNSTTGTLRGLDVVSAWSSSGSAITARQAGGAAGQGPQTASLMFGGYTPPPFSSLTEEYNGSGFSTGGALPAAVADNRGAGTQTAALSFMGLSNPSTHINASFEYDGSSWGSPTTMNTSRYSGGGAGIQTAGLAYGGYTTTTSNATEEYDGSSWTSVNNMSTARYSFGTAGIQTSAIAVSGVTTTRVANVEEYDGTNWTAGTNYPITTGGTQGFGATNTAAIFAGGATSPPTILTTCNSYNGTSFASVPSLSNSASGGYTGGSNTAGLYMSGIRTAPGTSAGDTEEYNKSANVITAAAWASGANLPTAVFTQAAAGVKTEALVFGGRVPPTVDQNATYEYDGAAWSSGGNLNQARRVITGCGTQTAALAAGGHYGSPSTNYSVAEEYNGSSWTNGGTFNSPLHGGQGTTGIQTAAVTAGGYPSNTSVENYDGSTWTSVTTLPQGRVTTAFGSQTAAVFAGGYATAVVDTVNEYDGSTISSGTSLPAARNDASASQSAPSTSGSYFAGTGSPGATVTTALKYDGTTWSTIPSISTGRSNGGGSGDFNNAFVAGGYNGTAAIATTEEFTGETTAINVKTLTQS